MFHSPSTSSSRTCCGSRATIVGSSSGAFMNWNRPCTVSTLTITPAPCNNIHLTFLPASSTVDPARLLRPRSSSLRTPALSHARATREFFTEAERVPPASFPVRLVSLAHHRRCRPLHRSARDLIRRATERCCVYRCPDSTTRTGCARSLGFVSLDYHAVITCFPTAIPSPIAAILF